MSKGLFRRDKFTGMGPCGLDAAGTARPTASGQARRGSRLRDFVRRECPRLPGVYGMVDTTGELIYVGKAKSLRARLMGYFRPNSRDDKAGKIIEEARRLVWEIAPSEFSALLRELELIRRWQPRHNVQGQPRRHRRCYVCVGRRPAPHVFVAAKPPRTAVAVFGPVPGMTRATEAVRRLNDWYRLRDCPQKQQMRFADQAELFPATAPQGAGCLRHEIGNCLAPCAGACSRREYRYNLDAAVDFLRGRDRTPLEQLERQRNEAATRLEFERAALFRDRHRSLEWLFNHLERTRQAVQHSFVYPVENHDGTRTWHLVHRGLVRAAVAAPDDEAARAVARLRLEEVYGSSAAGTPGLDEIDGVLLVAGWFRKHKGEQAKVLEVESARGLCVGAPAPQGAS